MLIFSNVLSMPGTLVITCFRTEVFFWKAHRALMGEVDPIACELKMCLCLTAVEHYMPKWMIPSNFAPGEAFFVKKIETSMLNFCLLSPCTVQLCIHFMHHVVSWIFQKERTGFVEEALSDFTGIAIGFVGSGKSANLFFPLFLLFTGAQVAISYVG